MDGAGSRLRLDMQCRRQEERWGGRHRELHKRLRLWEEERATGTLNGNVTSSPLIGPDGVQLVGTLVIMFKPKAPGGRDLGL